MSRILTIILAVAAAVLSLLYLLGIASDVTVKNPAVPEIIEPEPVQIEEPVYFDGPEYENTLYLNTIRMAAPQGYELETDFYDYGVSTYGINPETGGEFDIVCMDTADFEPEEIMDIYRSEYPDAEDTVINGIPCLIAYDPDSDSDMCILNDGAGNTYIMAFGRVDGENIGREYFNTIICIQ